MSEDQPPGCVQHPVNELNCAACASMRSEHYALLDGAAYDALRLEHESADPDPHPPTSWFRQRADHPPTDEELDEWVKGLGKADYL